MGTNPILNFIFIVVLIFCVVVMLYTGHLDKKREERKKGKKNIEKC